MKMCSLEAITAMWSILLKQEQFHFRGEFTFAGIIDWTDERSLLWALEGNKYWPLTAIVLESCRMVLAAATWTVTVCSPSVGNVYETLPSSVIRGCEHKRAFTNLSMNLWTHRLPPALSPAGWNTSTVMVSCHTRDGSRPSNSFCTAECWYV